MLRGCREQASRKAAIAHSLGWAEVPASPGGGCLRLELATPPGLSAASEATDCWLRSPCVPCARPSAAQAPPLQAHRDWQSCRHRAEAQKRAEKGMWRGRGRGREGALQAEAWKVGLNGQHIPW